MRTIVIKVLLAAMLIGLLSWYGYHAYERANGDFVRSYPSDDGLYTAEIYILRRPFLNFDYLFEVKIRDANGEVVKTSSESVYELSMVFWDCDSKKCSGFNWGNEERHYMTVPPSFFDRFLAKLP